MSESVRNWLMIQTYCHVREKSVPNKKFEKILAQNSEMAYFYSLRILHGRFLRGEKIIAQDPHWAVKYARFILKNRFTIAEKIIATNLMCCYEYYKYVVKGRLPDYMHEKMLIFSFLHPEQELVKKYFQEISNVK